jgi:hypothetical protein
MSKGKRPYGTKLSRFTLLGLTVFALLAIVTTSALMFGPVAGAIFTTNSLCTGTNVNIFTNKADVYLDGGPAHPGAAGLPDGNYYVKVTEPDGTLLGTTVGTTNETPVVVSSGEFAVCYQLSSILRKASTDVSGGPVAPDGYDTTTNSGSEYKVWVSQDPDFANDNTKTDNFKVIENNVIQQGSLSVIKFYDANANGSNDDGQLITGWKVRITDGIDLIRFTPTTVLVAPDNYIVSEFSPAETNWIRTTPSPVNVTIANGDTKTVEFGNLCLGTGGGKTLGFWSNKNGQAQMNDGGSDASELALLTSLCLRNASGTAFDPATYTAFRTWILSASATNMAYMLSAQLAAMELNVEAGFVSGSALIYAPGTTSANSLGFATVNAVMTEANATLCANGLVLSGNPERTHQEALKNALDNANNNTSFVQGTPCPFTF